MKREYLVLYDYGMGGIWAYLTAENEDHPRAIPAASGRDGEAVLVDNAG
jgi:hypothetical protein